MSIKQTASETSQQGLLAGLAAFSASMRLERIPVEVIHQAKLTIVDTLACMAAGMQDDAAAPLIRAESERSRLPEASVIGMEQRLDMQAAIRINGYLGDIFELNDLTSGHAGIAVISTTLALAEALGRSGRELIEAIVCGIEVTSRVYSAYYPHMKSYEQTAITPPGIHSTIGSAAAAARLFGLDAARTAHAMQIAATLAGWCPAEVIFGQGGQVKPMLFGAWPGSVAVQGALYARAGMDGPAYLLESGIGLYATLAHRYDAAAVTDTGRWYLEHPRRKWHACCGYIHSALDAVVALRAEGVDVLRAAAIEVRMPQYIIPGVSKAGPPQSATEARFHAEYCLALALSGVEAIKPEHSSRHHEHLPAALPIMARIRIAADDGLTHYHQSVVRGLDAGGQELYQKKVTSPKGSPDNPMSDHDVREKFRTLAAQRMPADRVGHFLERIDALEQAQECGWIVRAFV